MAMQVEALPTHREDPLRSIGEVASQIGRHRDTVRQWAKDGLFDVVTQPDGRIFVRQSVINRFLSATNLSKEMANDG